MSSMCVDVFCEEAKYKVQFPLQLVSLDSSAVIRGALRRQYGRQPVFTLTNVG